MKWSKILGAIFVLLGVFGTVMGLAFESAMIIALGIHAVSFLTTAAAVGIGLGVLLFGLGYVPQIKHRLAQGQAKKLLQEKIESYEEQTAEYEADALNPTRVRMRLLQLRSRNEHLRDLTRICIEQKDKIDMFQDQLDRLIQANEALYLKDLPAVLDSAEERMCANFRDIINCCILVEHNGQPLNEYGKEITKQALEANMEELQAVSELLNKSVKYINEYNRKGVRDRSDLDAWIKIMERNTNKREELTL